MIDGLNAALLITALLITFLVIFVFDNKREIQILKSKSTHPTRLRDAVVTKKLEDKIRDSERKALAEKLAFLKSKAEQDDHAQLVYLIDKLLEDFQ